MFRANRFQTKIGTSADVFKQLQLTQRSQNLLAELLVKMQPAPKT
jgi:hypothetical protein